MSEHSGDLFPERVDAEALERAAARAGALVAAQARSVLEATHAHAQGLKDEAQRAAAADLRTAYEAARPVRTSIDAITDDFGRALSVVRSERDRLARELRVIEQLAPVLDAAEPVDEGDTGERPEATVPDAEVVEEGAPEPSAQQAPAPAEPLAAAAPPPPVEAAAEAPPAPPEAPAEPTHEPGLSVPRLRRPGEVDMSAGGIQAPSRFLDLPADQAGAAAQHPCRRCEATGRCSSCAGRGKIFLGFRCPSCRGAGFCPRCQGTGVAPATTTPPAR